MELMDMRFEVSRAEDIIVGRAVYDTANSTFQFEGDVRGVTSVLMCRDYVQMEVDEDGRALYVWGFAPQQWWIDTSARPPQSSRGSLRVEPDDERIPGISIRVPGASEWEISYDSHTSWICVGSITTTEGAQAIEFASDTIAIVHQNKLEAIWIRPELR